jgi:hypothetical protein
MRAVARAYNCALRVRRSIIEAFGFERNNGTSREHLRRLRRFRGRLPADFRFDRLEANERR